MTSAEEFSGASHVAGISDLQIKPADFLTAPDILGQNLKLFCTEVEGGNTLFVGMVDGFNIRGSDLISMLTAMKTNPDTLGVNGILADWMNPRFVEAHRALGKRGEWDSLLTNLPALTELLKTNLEMDRFMYVEDIWQRAINVINTPDFYSLYLNPSGDKNENQLFNAFDNFIYGDGGGRIIEQIRDLERQGKLSPLENRLGFGRFILHKGDSGFHIDNMTSGDQLKEYADLIRKDTSLFEVHTQVVAEFLKSLGENPTERFYKILCLMYGDEKLGWHESKKSYFDIDWPQSLTIDDGYHHIRNAVYSLEEGYLHIRIQGKKGFVIEVREPLTGLNTEKLLQPNFINVTEQFHSPLIPVFAWVKNDGSRKWVYDLETIQPILETMTGSDSEFELESAYSTLAGFLTLVYVQPDLRTGRNAFPQTMAFHQGGREQQMLEAQVPYLAMMRENSFLKILENFEPMAKSFSAE